MIKRLSIAICILAPLSLHNAPGAYGATVAQIGVMCDVVVVGSVGSWTETATNVSFDISVRSVLKGAGVPATVHVSHQWTRAGFGSPADELSTFTQAIEGIWCLEPGASMDWDVQGLAAPDGVFAGLFLPAAPTLPAAYQVQAAFPNTMRFSTSPPGWKRMVCTLR